MNYIAKILNIIYPIKCVECGRISKKYICSKCKVRTGIKIEFHEELYINKNYTKHIYLEKYNGNIREKIIKYKFRNKAYLYGFFSELIIEANKKNEILSQYNYIVPVPISNKRKNQRGYNQSELIAKEIASKINNVSLVRIIRKRIDNTAQSTLNKENRKLNVKDVYEINKKEFIKYESRITNKKFLIIDDIYTTGNTVNEVAKVLRENGIKNIDVMTIAKD